MRKFLVVVVLFLAISVVILSFSELHDVVLTLQRAKAGFVLLAVLTETAWILVLGRIFHAIYSLLGLEESKEHMTLLASASSFVGVVAAGAAVGGLAMFVLDGRRRGHPAGKVTVAGALYMLLDEAAFLCVLALGIVVLIRRNHLGAVQIVASLILLSLALAFGSLLFLAYRSPNKLGNLLARLAAIVNWLVHPLIHREYLSERRAHEFAADVSEGLGSLPEKPRILIQPLLLTLFSKVLMMGVLTFCFLAFDVAFSAGTIVAGYAISYLFVIVSPTPAGVGIVEGVMAVALRTLGVDYSQAVIITLAYVGMTFWFPFAVGAVSFRNLQVKVNPASELAAPTSHPGA